VLLACDWVIIIEDGCCWTPDGWELPIVEATEPRGRIGCIDRQTDMRELEREMFDRGV
jgi:hypothetical protein